MSRSSKNKPWGPAAIEPLRRMSKRSFLFMEFVIVGIFCLAFAFLVYSFATSASVTCDETSYLPAGYSYLLWNDYRMDPEHPPLVKKLAALPLLALDVWPRKSDFPGQQGEGHQSASLLLLRQYWESALTDPGPAQWGFGRTLLFGIRDDCLRRLRVSSPEMTPPSAKLDRADFLNNADQMLMWGRMVILSLGLLLAVLIYSWARELHGMAGGVLALALFCLDPNCIAHSGLVTMDIGTSVFIFGAVYFLWRTCRRLNIINVAFTAVFFALAFVTRFSAVLLLPIFGLIGAWHVFTPGNWLLPGRRQLAGRLQKSLAFAALSIACCVAAFVMIWAMYGFRYTAIAGPAGSLPIADVVHRTAAMKSLLKQYPQEIPEANIQAGMGTAAPGFTGNLVFFAQRHHLLPEAYIYGFAYQRLVLLTRSSFLMGEYSVRGFGSYFFWCFLFKTPLPALLLIAASLVVGFRTRMRRHLPWVFLALPIGIYGLAAVDSAPNIGHRQLLPLYPFLFVFCSLLAVKWKEWKTSLRRWTVFVALGGIAVSSTVVFAPPWKPAVVFPHYLAYFNELAGGPRNGEKLLVDSNLDWGQDLKGLKEWMNVHLTSGQAPQLINLCYFGTGDPRYYGIPHVNMPGGCDFETPMETFTGNNDGGVSITNAVTPGYLAISASHVEGVFFNPLTRKLWREVLGHATLVDTVGYSIYIYKLEAPKESLPPQDNAADLVNDGVRLLRGGRGAEAIIQFQKALKIKPDYAEACNDLAYVWATSPDPLLRDGAKAESAARKANQLTGGSNPAILGTLAAAYAEQGRFSEAVETVQRAIQLAEAQGNYAMGQVLRKNLRIYQSGQPLRNNP